MRDFDYKIISALESENLINRVLQTLPAYLLLNFHSEGKYKVKIESPDSEIMNEIKGETYSGYNYYWRIPIFESVGIWTLSIQFRKKDEKETETNYVLIDVPSSLFDYSDNKEDEDDYLREMSKYLPSKDEIKSIDITSRLAELDAHWLNINPELKIWRYIHDDTERKLDEERFLPILLVHGFHSSYTTWNWMVRYLWADGFRNIFAMTLYDDALGVEKNTEKMQDVIDEILDLTNHESLCFLGHSLGGFMGRYYVKKFDPKKIELLVTMGSPHMCGLNRYWGKIFTLLKKDADIMERDVTLQPSSSVKETQDIITEADFYQQTMVNICGTKIRGGDGGFKLKDNLVPDMINIGVNAIHMTVNKHEASYKIIRNLLLGKAIIYKIRLLYINPITNSPKKSKLFLYIRSSEKEDFHRYPFRDYFFLKKNEPYIPEAPLIVYTNMVARKNVQSKCIEIQIRNEKNQILTQTSTIIPLGYKKPVCDPFQIDSEQGYILQFAAYSYRIIGLTETLCS